MLLTSGPFTYPYGFSNLGPIISIPLMAISTFGAYITATYILEAISISNAMRNKGRIETLFPEDTYISKE